MRLAFDMIFGVEDFYDGDTFTQLAKQRACEQAGMQGTEAVVNPAAESDMGIGLPIQMNFIRFFKNGGIPVGRGPAEGNPLTGFDRHTFNFGGVRADAADVGQRGDESEEFFRCRI